jgi:hypothetical protein
VRESVLRAETEAQREHLEAESHRIEELFAQAGDLHRELSALRMANERVDGHTPPDESNRLRAENARLRSEVDRLKANWRANKN